MSKQFPATLGESDFRLVLNASYSDKYGDGIVTLKEVFETKGKYVIVKCSHTYFSTVPEPTLTLTKSIERLISMLETEEGAKTHGVEFNMFRPTDEERTTIMRVWNTWNTKESENEQ